MALHANDLSEVKRLLVEDIRPMSGAMEHRIDALSMVQIKEAKNEYDAAVARYATSRAITIAATVGGLLFAGVFGFTMVRSITRQLGGEPGEAAGLAQGVAAGDLSVPIRIQPGDTTSLMVKLKAMLDSLVNVVGNVRLNSASVATASAQIAQGDQIVAVPAVIRRLPKPLRMLIVDMSDSERVLIGLGLLPR